MKDKYYTPEIEEFHVGFEYEITTMSTGGLIMMDFKKGISETISKPTHKVWEKTKVSSTASDTGKMITRPFDDGFISYEDVTFPSDHRTLEEIISLLKSDQIRVKCLDKEDIKSESFNYKPINGEKDVMLFNSDRKDSRGEKVSLIYNPKSNWLLVSTGEWSITVWEEYNSYNFNPTLFAGYIKNATEFKKILKQLNINEKTN